MAISSAKEMLAEGLARDIAARVAARAHLPSRKSRAGRIFGKPAQSICLNSGNLSFAIRAGVPPASAARIGAGVRR